MTRTILFDSLVAKVTEFGAAEFRLALARTDDDYAARRHAASAAFDEVLRLAGTLRDLKED